jgi:nucleotide-binding universal stress UspA family protein
MDSRLIVVGIDGSEDSLAALRWAVREARMRNCVVRAVMTYELADTEAALLAGPSADDIRRRAEDTVAQAVERLKAAYPDVRIATEVVPGQPARVLAALTRGASLLVIASHGRGRLYHALLGSVAEECIRSAACPVVVLPSRRGSTDQAVAGDLSQPASPDPGPLVR